MTAKGVTVAKKASGSEQRKMLELNYNITVLVSANK
jgi:hypothetical protein